MHKIAKALLFAGLLAACGGKGGTTWNGTFAAPVARPEHPRPDFARASFINLNTRWDFAYDPTNKGRDERWYRRSDVWTDKIQLPFAWEAPLAGLVPPHEGPYSIADTLKASTYRGVAWYRLRLPAPLAAAPGYDWHLVFGAVDFKATVSINGVEAVTHVGGYEPFSVNLGEYARAGDTVTIVVRVEDFTELNDRAQPVGKQGGVWYTRTSGIWQTVYLERRPAAYITGLQIMPEPDAGRVRVRIALNRATTGSIRLAAALPVTTGVDEPVGETTAPLAGTTSVEAFVPLAKVLRWDAETPTLYDLRLRLEADDARADEVTSYFGLVTVTTDWLPGRSPAATADVTRQAKALYVNGRPRYLRCVLDQSYHPDGVYTAASVDAIRRDLAIARSFGFNCIRLHIKTDEPIKYRLLDELGFYVVYDIVALDIMAANEKGFAGRTYYEDNLVASMTRDRNHPAIVAWVVFNENWGLIRNGSLTDPTLLAEAPDLQHWVRDMVGLARALDPTRPLEDNSAGGVVVNYEHLTGDLNSFHYYGSDAAAYRALLDREAAGVYPGSATNYVGGAVQDGDPWWNSEFASFSVLGDSGAGIFCDLFGLVNEMRRQPKLVGWVLTELTDVEYETNGLVAYDRSEKEDLCTRAGVGLVDIFGDDHVAFDWLPGQAVTAGTLVSVPLQFSQWSAAQARSLSVRLRWNDGAVAATSDFSTAPFDVKPLVVTVAAPAGAGPADLVAEVVDGRGRRIAANRFTVAVTQ